MPTTLSERDSKALLAPYGIPLAAERLVDQPRSRSRGCHRVGLSRLRSSCAATTSPTRPSGAWSASDCRRRRGGGGRHGLLAAARPEDGDVGVLVAPMVSGNRELIAGFATRSAVRDAP